MTSYKVVFLIYRTNRPIAHIIVYQHSYHIDLCIVLTQQLSHCIRPLHRRDIFETRVSDAS
jgi:hypothetical protein